MATLEATLPDSGAVASASTSYDAEASSSSSRPLQRKPSITIAVPPSPIRSSLRLGTPPLPPSPHFRARTTIDPSTGTIVLPTVPTHEPEDRLNSPRVSDVGRLSVDEAPSRLSSDRGDHASVSSMSMDAHDVGEEMETIDDGADYEEEEEILEELADPAPGEDAAVMSRNDFAGLILATQAAALLALRVLLQEMQQQTHAGHEAYLHLVDMLVAAVNDLSGQDTPASPREAGFRRLNNLLDSLSSEALVVGSQGSGGDGVNLATALGDLLLSLDQVRPASDPAAVEAARLQALPPTRQRSSSTVSSSPELRDPFAESSSEPNVFATLHRLIASLAARCPIARRQPSPLASPGLDIARRSFARSSTSSLATASSKTSSVFFPRGGGSGDTEAWFHLDTTANPEAWSHVAHILGLTRDLVASRRATQSQHDAGTMSPHRGRSRKGSAASSDAASAGPAAAVDVRRSLQISRRTGTAAPLQRKPSTSSLPRTSLSSSNGAHSLPPSYSEHERRRSIGNAAGLVGASDAQIRDYQSRGILPSYGYEEKSSSANRSTSPPRSILKKTGLVGRPKSPSQLSESETMSLSSSSHDYEGRRLQKSIERVYANAPPLNDQRAQPAIAGAATRNRDVTLQELIDRLAHSGKRLDDQRCAPPTARASSSKKKQVAAEASIGAMPSPSSRSSSQEKAPQREGVRSSVLRKLSSGALLASSLRRRGSLSTKSKSARSPQMEQVALPPVSRSPLADVGSSSSSPWSSSREEAADGAALFELLAASSSKSRFADQEAVMRSPRERQQRLGSATAYGGTVDSATSFVTAPIAASSPADWSASVNGPASAGPAVPAKSPARWAGTAGEGEGLEGSSDLAADVQTIRKPSQSDSIFAQQQAAAMQTTLAKAPAVPQRAVAEDFAQGAEPSTAPPVAAATVPPRLSMSTALAPSPSPTSPAASTPTQAQQQQQQQIPHPQQQQHRKAVPVL